MRVLRKIILAGVVVSGLVGFAYACWEYAQRGSFLFFSKVDSIMGKGKATEQMMVDYFCKNNKRIMPERLMYIVKTYIWESEYEGVNHDVAFCQMCYETNFLRFGGSIDAEQNNFCGLATMDYGLHWACFFTIREGVRAHVQHLKAYGSELPLINNCIDARFGLVKRGCAKSVLDLTSKWHIEGDYGGVLQSKIDTLLHRK
ncbi:MAG: glucosaminidase domain-containing protein [Puniceicoccales bacterium]|jgi:hypothetical protein|nr:glucosaminidase domain-containing protein [Puniceicoccales bacterium]